MIEIQLPLSENIIESLHSGDSLFLSGVIYVARDAAHKRLVEALMKGESLPFDIKNQIIYYMGPSPPRPGKVIGAAGPTTSGRMDVYSELLMEHGLKGMIG
jgi:fumarate hydratase subunit beta